jgi:PEP-CTERM motif-containing protein
MRRGSAIAVVCQLCLLFALGSIPALADRSTDLDDINQKASSHRGTTSSGYVPWKDMIRSLKDSDFDGILAIHWNSGFTTFSKAFSHPGRKGHSDVSGDSILQMSEIMGCVSSNNGCKRQALFGLAGTSSGSPSLNENENGDHTAASPSLNTAGLAADDPVSTNTTLATPEPGSGFLLALGLAGLSPIFLRRRKPAQATPGRG